MPCGAAIGRTVEIKLAIELLGPRGEFRIDTGTTQRVLDFLCHRGVQSM
jgi:hypothetical protein